MPPALSAANFVGGGLKGFVIFLSSLTLEVAAIAAVDSVRTAIETGLSIEGAVLKTLGPTRGRILLSFALRYALLGLAAGLVALAAGIAGGWAVSTFIMSIEYIVIWPSALAIIAGGVIATLVAGLLFAWGPLAARPAQVLQARE